MERRKEGCPTSFEVGIQSITKRVEGACLIRAGRAVPISHTDTTFGAFQKIGSDTNERVNGSCRVRLVSTDLLRFLLPLGLG